MQWFSWLLLIGVVALLSTTSSASSSSSSNTPREVKALKAALKKQQRIKEQQRNKVGGSGKGTGEFVPEAGPWSSVELEPSCEQLREMWRQSKRHARAAETTNEIPQYSDPFARTYARQLVGAAEPTLRPRPERRPVVYGRLHSSPPSDELAPAPRPFEILRKLKTDEESPVATDLSSPPVILYGEDDKSPFSRPPAKGSLQHLRELVREENGPSSTKGSFNTLRGIIREEQQQLNGRPSSHQVRSSDWGDADVGRIVTSPSEHNGGSKYSTLYHSMQGDAPYESPAPRRPSGQQSRASGIFGLANVKGQRNKGQLLEEPTAARSAGKVFQKVDPPRPRLSANQRNVVGHSRHQANVDQGIVRGHVVGRDPFYSRPSRRTATTAVQQSSDCAAEDEQQPTTRQCRNHSDCRKCPTLGRCMGKRCLTLTRTAKGRRDANIFKTPANAAGDDEEDQDDDGGESVRDDTEDGRPYDDSISDIVDMLRDIVAESDYNSE